ncbi:AraC family transcriptional regulator [Sandaracinus amylolyticus]|uniref:AraC family transcriptional regulator n=1 Tax=Sandaracinus amylolyticus TaxID=927083 RepID=UPI001F3FD89B|nr:AraC family transcriptional regulator [Sandaracinus amylolyticus]UJR85262.1 Hypothetical protein I5071_73420 [Sandaracinus amylolyticus]
MSRRLTELLELIDRFTGGDGEHPTAIDELTFFRQSAPSTAVPVLYQPSLCVIAQGTKRMRLGEEVLDYDPAHFLIVSADVPMMGEVTRASPRAPYLALRIGLDTSMVAELVAASDRREAARTPLARAVAVSPMEPALVDVLTRLVSLLETPDDQPVLAPLALREITYRLLAGPQGPRLRQIAARDGQARRIVRALSWLQENFAAPLRIDALAREVGMSASALHHYFKSVTAMSPLQYQKRLRLHEARRLMVGEGLSATDASFRVGYESPSQFSREYRRLFGAPPQRDIAALRDDLSSPDAA